MPSDYTTRNRLEQQATGENLSTWGDRLNDNVIGLVDAALDGVTTISTSGAVVLTSSNAAPDQARNRTINITGGTGNTITIPNLEKTYFVRNGSTGDVVITTSGGTTTATIGAGVNKWVFCDGDDNVYQETIEDFGDLDITTTGDGSFGTITTTGTASFGNYVDCSQMLRALGSTPPETDAGVEIYYTGTAVVRGYDRDASAHKPLYLQGSSVTIDQNGNAMLVVSSSGYQFNGLASGTGTSLVHDGSGFMKRTTSSRRYKKEIRPLTTEQACDLLKLQPVTYEAKDGDEGRRFLGFIAEDAHEAGLGHLVHYNAEGQPESFAYERVTVGLIALAKVQATQIAQLQARLDGMGA